jgi:hypothetical protein
MQTLNLSKMKKLSIILACALVALAACTKSKEVHPELGDGNDEIITVGIKDVHVEYTRTDHAELNRVVFHYSLAEVQQFEAAEMAKRETFFELTLDNLLCDALYSYYYELFYNGGETSITKRKTFRTYSCDAPIPPTPPSGEYIEVSCISVNRDAWFVLDHSYSDGETITLEKATFGLYGAADDARHQQLISGGDGELLRIGQSGLIWIDYSKLYFNMMDVIEEFYGHVTSVDEGYILDHANVVFSPTFIKINGDLVKSYPEKHLSLNTNMCLFANDLSGTDSVRDQTATLGTVTITNNQGDIVARYIPVLDSNGRPCFYNTVSGAFIYHSGSGTPGYQL